MQWRRNASLLLCSAVEHKKYLNSSSRQELALRFTEDHIYCTLHYLSKLQQAKKGQQRWKISDGDSFPVGTLRQEDELATFFSPLPFPVTQMTQHEWRAGTYWKSKKATMTMRELSTASERQQGLHQGLCEGRPLSCLDPSRSATLPVDHPGGVPLDRAEPGRAEKRRRL
jgi:hypothetical protein